MISEYLFRNYIQEGERIFLVIHKHLFLVIGKFFKIVFFGMSLPLLLWILFPQLWIVSLVWAWFGLKVFAYNTIKWYFDAWLVTDISIIVIDWKGFFNKSSTRVEYHFTDEVSYEITGFIPTVFNYGRIILVRGSGNPLVFEGTWRPRKKVDAMLQYQDQFIQKKNFRDHKTLKSMLADMLHLHQVKEGVEPSLLDRD